MAQKYTEARKEGNRKWDAANLDRISIALPKGKKDDVKVAAVAVGESMNQYIINAVEQRMEQDAGGPQEAAGAALGPVVSLTPEALKTAQEAAEAAGEDLPQFVTRAIESRAALDKRKGGKQK